MQVVWFKRDLRAKDHEPLAKALKEVSEMGPVCALYIHEPVVIESVYTTRQHQVFIDECLLQLNEALKSLGGELIECVGQAEEVFGVLHEKFGISQILSHIEVSQLDCYKRDQAVSAWCKSMGVGYIECAQNNVARGPHKSVSFADYFEKSKTLIEVKVVSDKSFVLGKEVVQKCGSKLVEKEQRKIAKGDDKPQRLVGGRVWVGQRAKAFFDIASLLKYPQSISAPGRAEHGGSRMSCALAYGLVSDRQLMHTLDVCMTKSFHRLEQEQRLGDFDKLQSAAQFFVQRLSWRQGFYDLFEKNTWIENQEVIEGFENLRKMDANEQWFKAFCAGQTGYPFIDAMMRCLKQKGWLNFRGRATLVSFACMQLWLPWEWVMAYLAGEFLDFDMPIHACQHRIASGTAPFSQVMIYDPIKQSLEHDAQGQFIRHWVPELRAVPAKWIHQPWQMSQSEQQSVGLVMGVGYPMPLIDNEASLKRAKQIVFEVRKKSGIR